MKTLDRLLYIIAFLFLVVCFVSCTATNYTLSRVMHNETQKKSWTYKFDPIRKEITTFYTDSNKYEGGPADVHLTLQDNKNPLVLDGTYAIDVINFKTDTKSCYVGSENNVLIDAVLRSIGLTESGEEQLTIIYSPFNVDNSKQCKILISDITSIEIYDIDVLDESKFESISKKIIENKEKNPLTLLDKPTRVIPKEEIGHLEMEFDDSSEPVPISDIEKIKINTPSYGGIVEAFLIGTGILTDVIILLIVLL